MPDVGADRPGYVLGIVHHRAEHLVVQLVEASRSWTVPPARVVVVDNSGDLSASFVSGAGAHVIVPDHNVGYAAAANLLLDAAARAVAGPGTGSRLLLATQDCVLEPGSAGALLAALDGTPAAAVAAPELYFVGDRTTVFSLGGVITPWSRTLHPGQGSPRPGGATTRTHEVDWADGCCLMLDTAAALAIGGFEERFFLYVEEVDFSCRVREAGRTVVVVPTAIGYQQPGNYTLYYKYRNLLFWTSRHPGLRRWPWLLALPKDSLRMLRAGRLTQPGWALRGVLDFTRGRLGRAPERMWQP